MKSGLMHGLKVAFILVTDAPVAIGDFSGHEAEQRIAVIR